MMFCCRMFQLLALMVLAVSLLGCGPNKKERMKITELTTNVITVCIGRHLVDVPIAFTPMSIPWANNTFMPAGVDPQQAAQMSAEIVATGSTKEKFISDVEKILAANRLERPYQNKFPLLDHTEKLSENEVLIRLWDTELGKDGGYRMTEIHKLSENIHFLTRAKSYKNDYPNREKSLIEFTRNASAYDASKSNQKGYCLGPLIIDGKYESENTGFAFRSKQHPDMLLSFDMGTYSRDSETTLLQRASDPKNLLSIFGVGYSTLRKGALQVAGMKAEEVLVNFSGKDREGNTHLEHKLMMETYRPNPSASQPTLEARLITGQQGLDGQRHTSSLTDAEVTAVWDAVLKSIRLRPGAV
jgi:Tle cognate immunity protein 4 C-terminal domain